MEPSLFDQNMMAKLKEREKEIEAGDCIEITEPISADTIKRAIEERKKEQ